MIQHQTQYSEHHHIYDYAIINIGNAHMYAILDVSLCEGIIMIQFFYLCNIFLYYYSLNLQAYQFFCFANLAVTCT